MSQLPSSHSPPPPKNQADGNFENPLEQPSLPLMTTQAVP